MSKHEVDARGKLCPVPVVMTKEVFDELSIDETMVVLVDNDVSANNVKNFVEESAGKAEISKDDDVSVIKITRLAYKESKNAEEYCNITPIQHVVYISTDKIGQDVGEDLGKALMQTFLQTIKDVTPLPSHVIFIHNGVSLLKNGTKTAEITQDLIEKGVKVLACGTCLDYFKLMDDIACGQVSNMYDILQTLTSAGKVIKP